MTAHGWLGAEAEAASRLLAECREAGFDDEAQQLTVESETNFKEAVENALAQADETEALADALLARIKAMGERVERLRHRRDRLRDAIAVALDASGVALPLRLPAATLSLSRRPGELVVTDEAAVPADYWRDVTVRKLDARALAAAVKGGTAVPGTAVGNPRHILTIRR